MKRKGKDHGKRAAYLLGMMGRAMGGVDCATLWLDTRREPVAPKRRAALLKEARRGISAKVK